MGFSMGLSMSIEESALAMGTEQFNGCPGVHSNMPHTVTVHLSKHPHKTQAFLVVAGNST